MTLKRGVWRGKRLSSMIFNLSRRPDAFVAEAFGTRLGYLKDTALISNVKFLPIISPWSRQEHWRDVHADVSTLQITDPRNVNMKQETNWCLRKYFNKTEFTTNIGIGSKRDLKNNQKYHIPERMTSAQSKREPTCR